MEACNKETVLCSYEAVAKFEEFRQNLKFCDVSLQSGHAVVKAHRAVLAAASPYFESLFNTSSKLSYEALVNVSDIPPEVLPSLVDFIYTGQVTLMPSTAQDLIVAAHKLSLDGLVRGCVHYLKTQLNTTNVLEMLSLAETLDSSKLTYHAMVYIGTYWTVIAYGKELLNLSLKVLVKILSSDDFVVHNELEVVLAVIRWLEHDPEARAPHCSELVRHLRLGRLPADILDEGWRIVRDARVAENLQQSKEESAAMANVRPRTHRAFFVLRNSNFESDKIWKYDAYNHDWECVTPMRKNRNDAGMVALEGLLYVVGGENDGVPLPSGEVYDPVTKSWSSIPEMGEGRTNFGCAALKGKLYVFGGDSVDRELASIEVYDPAVNEWAPAGNLPYPMSGLNAVSYKDSIYLTHARSLLRYSPLAEPHEKWKSYAEMYVMRKKPGAAVLDDHLYVVGGYKDTNDDVSVTYVVERYSFAEDRWEFVTPTSRRLGACAAGVAGDVLFVASKSGLETYDAHEGDWRLATDACEGYDVVDSAML